VVWSGTLRGRTRPEDPLETWRQYARDVRGFAAESGHFIPEEAPDAIRAPIAEFLAG
jgi:haloacetate dehalogenase